MDVAPESPSPEIVQQEPVPTAVVRGRVRMEELPSFYDRAYTLVASVLEQQGVQPLEAIGYYLSPPGEYFELEAGFTTAVPVTDETGVGEASGGEVVASSLPGGELARLTHLGAYDRLAESWGRLGRWIDEQGRRPGPGLWEVYVTEPTPETDPESRRTDLYWLLDG